LGFIKDTRNRYKQKGYVVVSADYSEHCRGASTDDLPKGYLS